jgi:hypothetical protein
MSQARDDMAEEREQSGHEAIIQDSWMRARKYLRKAEAIGIEPSRAIWPEQTPRPGTRHKAALQAHSAIIQFHDDVRPFRDERGAETFWERQVDQIKLPSGRTLAVSLENLEQWNDLHIEHKQQVNPPGEKATTQKRRKRILLPVETTRKTYRTILDMLHAGSVTAEVDFSEQHTRITEDLIEEVIEWQQENLNQ